MLGLLAAAFGWNAARGNGATRELAGLPFTRHYAFDQIGDVTRSSQLTFDQSGRLVAVQGRAYVVLNDDAWFDLGAKETDATKIVQVARDADGTTYYGALGAWGVVAMGDDGRMHARPFSPPNPPAWVLASNFGHILCRPEGIYFAGWNGLVFRDRRTQEHRFYEMPELTRVFAWRGKTYVSSHVKGMSVLTADGLVPDRSFGGQVVTHVAPLDGDRILVSNSNRRLFIRDPEKMPLLAVPLGERLGGAINALQALPEGNVAVAVSGVGVYIISPDGNISRALTSPQYRGISRFASNEPGVLWALSETGVLKILYGAPVTLYDQTVGIPISWPQLVNWRDNLAIASNGRIYEPAPAAAGEPARFQLMPEQPAAGTWGIAVHQDWLLAANGKAVFARRGAEPFRPVLAGTDIARLAMLDSGVCLVIGTSEIAALKCENGVWSECAPRVPGAGYPGNVHVAKASAWIEIGANLVARVAFKDGRLQTRVVDKFPWPQPRWIQISIIGKIVMLSGAELGRVFFDDEAERFCEPAALSAALAQAPHWIARLQADEHGTLWASHEHGLFTLTPKDGGYIADTTTFRLLHEHLPVVHRVAGHGMWVSTGDSLYQVHARTSSAPAPAFQPQLVSARDLRTQREYLMHPGRTAFPAAIAYGQNSLAFRFFAGSYASRRPPNYEYRINRNAWSSLEATSLLRLPDLNPGAYAVDVRLVDDRGPLGAPTSFAFTIAPPWYRAWYAIVAYACLGLASLVGVVRLSLHRARARNAALESVVADRTAELATTMEKLEQETRTAATLAERNRLAGEIHDSMEQGFSGLLLQLETTSGLGGCPPAVQNALTVARNMVAFSRNEVRHAVWDLHSPMLNSGGLEPALRSLISQIAPGETQPAVIVEGQPLSLGSTIEHHLLRIAQEAIANAVKHAGAAHLEVRLTFTAAEVGLSVSDDGKGFDSTAVLADARGHFGLRSLRGRAAKIGGTVTIESHPGTGTRIAVRVPILPAA